MKTSCCEESPPQADPSALADMSSRAFNKKRKTISDSPFFCCEGRDPRLTAGREPSVRPGGYELTLLHEKRPSSEDLLLRRESASGGSVRRGGYELTSIK